MSKLTILTPKKIAEEYNLPITLVYELLHIKNNPCPLVKGRKGKRFLVEKNAFEEWIKKRA